MDVRCNRDFWIHTAREETNRKGVEVCVNKTLSRTKAILEFYASFIGNFCGIYDGEFVF